MKLFSVIIVVLCFLGIQAQAWAQSGSATATSPIWDARGNATPGGGIMTFEEETHDLGELIQGGDASWLFVFTNTGTEDIFLWNVKSTCGCVSCKWSSEPVAPGETGEIIFIYDSNRIGPFDKCLHIDSNASEPFKRICVKGNVIPRPKEPSYLAPTVGAPSLPSEH